MGGDTRVGRVADSCQRTAASQLPSIPTSQHRKLEYFMFIPTTKDELNALGWESLDVILVTGDTYVDSPFIGVAVIGKVLMDAGYRVGIIAQPDITSDRDITPTGGAESFLGDYFGMHGLHDIQLYPHEQAAKTRRSDRRRG